jgi:hypothetical protein
MRIVVTTDFQIEFSGNSRGRLDLEARALRGQVAHQAIDDGAAVIEHNPAAEQRAPAVMLASFKHTRPPHCILNAEPPKHFDAIAASVADG